MADGDFADALNKALIIEGTSLVIAAKLQTDATKEVADLQREASAEAIEYYREALDKSIAYQTDALNSSLAYQNGALSASLAYQTDALNKSLAYQTNALDKSLAYQEKALTDSLNYQDTALTTSLQHQDTALSQAITDYDKLLKDALVYQEREMDFSKERYSQWEGSFMPIQFQTSDYAEALSEDDIGVRDTGLIGEQETKALRDITASAMIRCIPCSGIEVQLKRDVTIQSALAKASVRANARDKAFAIKQQYLALGINRGDTLAQIINQVNSNEANLEVANVNAKVNVRTNVLNNKANLVTATGNHKAQTVTSIMNNEANITSQTALNVSNLYGNASRALGNLYSHNGDSVANLYTNAGNNLANLTNSNANQIANIITNEANKLSSIGIANANTIAGYVTTGGAAIAQTSSTFASMQYHEKGEKQRRRINDNLVEMAPKINTPTVAQSFDGVIDDGVDGWLY